MSTFHRSRNRILNTSPIKHRLERERQTTTQPVPSQRMIRLSDEIVKRESKGEKRVVCYYTNWSVYRPGTAKFNPQNINPYLCTHLIYAFGGLDRENGLRPYDKYQDIEQGGYAKFTGLKTYNKALKTMLAIGGWNEGSARFSPLVADEDRRKEFVKNVVKFLRVNHFDGLDLDWEYPAFRDGGKPRDRDNYAQLVQELREEFEREASKTGRPRLLLTMAVPAGLEYIDKGYDIPKLNTYLDFMNILSYDYHSAFEPSINHHSPLYSLEEESEYNFDSQLTIDATVKHYIMKGADPDKLVLGIPTYGRSYTLFNEDSTDIGSPADGPGEQGDATREKGYLAYYEICANVKSGWTVIQPKESAMGPYAYKGNQWVGYDDEAIVKRKSQYVNEKNLGGIMFWSIDNDDFRGKCSSRPYPLIEAAKEALIGKLSSSSSSNKLPSSPRGGKTSSKLGKLKPSRTTTSAPTPSSVTITTPDPPTTPDPGSDFVCKDEGFFPHPRDCKKYFWCLDSGPSNLGIVAHQFTCPSGLFFNKAADSCDFARNVICNKKSTTTTTAAPKTSSSPSSKSKTTARTTTTTTTTTTTEPPPEEEEYFDEEDQEDPQTIKQLITLIKKLGGVAELEKQLEGGNTDSSTAPPISKSLYERVIIKNPAKPQTYYRNGPSGPQNEGLPKESGRSSYRNKDKPQYVTIRRERPSTSTTESLDSAEYEDEVEEEKEETPKYKTIQRNRGSQNEGLDSERSTTERSRPKYQPIERFRTRQQEKKTTNEEEISDSGPERTSTLRYMNIFRSRGTPSGSDTSTATTSRYVTLTRQRPQQTHSEEPTVTENELPEEEDITEELPVETTTTARPRIKVSDVLTTTPAVRTSTRVVTQVVEGSTQRQRVPLHKLKQLIKDSENFIETVTKPYLQTTTEEPKSERPILNNFNRRRPEIVVTSTARSAPAYLSQRRNKFRSTTTTTSTEAAEVTKKNRGFVPNRLRFKSRNEEAEKKEESDEAKPTKSRFYQRQKYNRNNSNESTEEANKSNESRFSNRQKSTTESSQSTTDRYSRNRNRYVTINRQRSTTKQPTTASDKEEDTLFKREFSRESSIVRRPVLTSSEDSNSESEIKDPVINENATDPTTSNVSENITVESSPETNVSSTQIENDSEPDLSNEKVDDSLNIIPEVADEIQSTNLTQKNPNNATEIKPPQEDNNSQIIITPTIIQTTSPPSTTASRFRHRSTTLRSTTIKNEIEKKEIENEVLSPKSDQETSSNDLLLETKNPSVQLEIHSQSKNRTKFILRKRKPQQSNSTSVSGESLKSVRQTSVSPTDSSNETRRGIGRKTLRGENNAINKQNNFSANKTRIIIRKRKPEPAGKSLQFDNLNHDKLDSSSENVTSVEKENEDQDSSILEKPRYITESDLASAAKGIQYEEKYQHNHDQHFTATSEKTIERRRKPETTIKSKNENDQSTTAKPTDTTESEHASAFKRIQYEEQYQHNHDQHFTATSERTIERRRNPETTIKIRNQYDQSTKAEPSDTLESEHASALKGIQYEEQYQHNHDQHFTATSERTIERRRNPETTIKSRNEYDQSTKAEPSDTLESEHASALKGIQYEEQYQHNHDQHFTATSEKTIERRRKPEATIKSRQYNANNQYDRDQQYSSTTAKTSVNKQRTSRGKTRFTANVQNTNSPERISSRSGNNQDQQTSTNRRRTVTIDRSQRVSSTTEAPLKHKRVIIRGRKKSAEEVKNKNSENDDFKKIITDETEPNNEKKGKMKVRRVILKKTIKDLAVGESGLVGSQENDYEITDNDHHRGSIKILDSLIKEDVDNFFIEDDNPSSGRQEITRSRRPFHRRPVSRSTTTTTTTQAPTTSRQRTTVQLLRQRLNRFKSERNLKPSTQSYEEEEPVTTARPRKGEYRRVVRPIKSQTLVEDSQIDSSQADPITKDTVSKTTQYLRESTFRRPANFVNPEDKIIQTAQIEEQATESSFTDEHITDAQGNIRFQESNEQEEEEIRIGDLANVAVAAIQSLATSPPTKATEQYTFTTPRTTTRYITTPRLRSRPTRPITTRPTTAPVIINRGLVRSSPRPFSKVTHSSRTLPDPAAAVYEDYEDYYAEPVDVPLSGKVRIHNDGYIECLDIGNFPHPFSCRKFISCAKMENGHLLGWEYTCPKGLSFDPIGGICNWNAGLGCKE